MILSSDDEKLTIVHFLNLNRKIEEGIGLAISQPFTNALSVMNEALALNKDILKKLTTFDPAPMDIQIAYNALVIETNTRGVIKNMRQAITRGIKFFVIDEIKKSQIEMLSVQKTIEMIIFKIHMNRTIVELKLSSLDKNALWTKSVFNTNQKTSPGLVRTTEKTMTSSSKLMDKTKAMKTRPDKGNQISGENPVVMKSNRIVSVRSDQNISGRTDQTGENTTIPGTGKDTNKAGTGQKKPVAVWKSKTTIQKKQGLSVKTNVSHPSEISQKDKSKNEKKALQSTLSSLVSSNAGQKKGLPSDTGEKMIGQGQSVTVSEPSVSGKEPSSGNKKNLGGLYRSIEDSGKKGLIQVKKNFSYLFLMPLLVLILFLIFLGLRPRR